MWYGNVYVVQMSLSLGALPPAQEYYFAVVYWLDKQVDLSRRSGDAARRGYTTCSDET